MHLSWAAMRSVPLLYRAAVGATRRLAPWVAGTVRPFGARGAKLARGLEARRDAAPGLAAWAARAREAGRPLAWVHAPSVGEALVAQAVLEALRARRPELQVAFTHFSPSVESWRDRLGADVATYLPWDTADEAASALDALRPNVLVFTRTEVWPGLVAGARARGVPVALVGGIVPPGAGRARWLARRLLRSTWGELSRACAVAQEDAARLVWLGVPEAAVRVTGDPAIDSATGRAQAADPAAPYLAPFHEEPRPTVVAGSTWPADEAVLVPALRTVRDLVPGLRVIFAPHEPTAEAVGGLLSRLQGLGWKARPLSAVESRGSPGDAAAVVVDRVGVLAHLYTVGSVAYVGGGFGDSGLHSVLEPAAAGLPVTFGPRIERAPGAAGLLAAGAARVAGDAEALAEALGTWLRDPESRNDASARAFSYIGAHSGAAARTAELLDALIASHASP